MSNVVGMFEMDKRRQQVLGTEYLKDQMNALDETIANYPGRRIWQWMKAVSDVLMLEEYAQYHTDYRIELDQKPEHTAVIFASILGEERHEMFLCIQASQLELEEGAELPPSLDKETYDYVIGLMKEHDQGDATVCTPMIEKSLEYIAGVEEVFLAGIECSPEEGLFAFQYWNTADKLLYDVQIDYSVVWDDIHDRTKRSKS